MKYFLYDIGSFKRKIISHILLQFSSICYWIQPENKKMIWRLRFKVDIKQKLEQKVIWQEPRFIDGNLQLYSTKTDMTSISLC